MTRKSDLYPTPNRWRDAQRATFTRPEQLPGGGAAAAATAPSAAARLAHQQFAVRVPPAFADLVNWDRPDDPLRRQVWPDARETEPAAGFGADPVGELEARHAGGILHRYANRVLIVTTGACAINCRYCFRRHFPYGESTRRDWQPAVDYLQAHTEVDEVILSGGDPLMLSTDRLAELTRALAAVSHLRRLRIHSRMPLVAPQRIDEPLLKWLTDLPWPATLVIHCNHSQELGAAGRAVLASLRATGLTLLNQSVLLAGVNDNADTLAALSTDLFAAGVLPYYLHQLDPVAGAAHFAVDDASARRLHAQLRSRLPGYLLPRLVRDTPGTGAKQPL